MRHRQETANDRLFCTTLGDWCEILDSLLPESRIGFNGCGGGGSARPLGTRESPRPQCIVGVWVAYTMCAPGQFLRPEDRLAGVRPSRPERTYRRSFLATTGRALSPLPSSQLSLPCSLVPSSSLVPFLPFFLPFPPPRPVRPSPVVHSLSVPLCMMPRVLVHTRDSSRQPRNANAK